MEDHALLQHFRKSLSGGWICTAALLLPGAKGKMQRVRCGQNIYTGDITYEGHDLASLLTALAPQNPLGELADTSLTPAQYRISAA